MRRLGQVESADFNTSFSKYSLHTLNLCDDRLNVGNTRHLFFLVNSSLVLFSLYDAAQ